MPRPTRPVPEDFARYASIEGNLRLRVRYGVGGATVERWRQIIGARYNRPAMPKRAPAVAVKRARKRWYAQERIEDLDDGFDLATCVRTGGYGNWD